MHLCFVCPEYPPGPHGGIGTVTQLLARGLVQAGHRVRVIGICSKDCPASDYEEDHGVRVWRLREPPVRLGWILARHRMWRQIARWCRREMIDVVEVPDWQGWAAGWPRLPVPVVARLHGSASYFAAELGTSLKWTARYLERASLRRADFWCSASRYTADKTPLAVRLPSRSATILYNPVEIRSGENDVFRTKNEVVFTGTLTPKKGIQTLIEAWPRVRDKCPDAELHLYGKDGRTSDGQSMTAFLGQRLEGRTRASVHFHGHAGRAKILEALQRASVAVFPSYAEAFALAPMEAMACGCPTIYSQRTSGPELIEHGHTGWLVPPDQPPWIADSITRILKDDRLAAQLGAAGRQHVQQNFSVDRLVAQNVDFYEQAVTKFNERLAYVRLSSLTKAGDPRPVSLERLTCRESQSVAE